MLGGVVYDGFGMDAAFGSMAIISFFGAAVVTVFLSGTRHSSKTDISSRTGEYKETDGSYCRMFKG